MGRLDLILDSLRADRTKPEALRYLKGERLKSTPLGNGGGLGTRTTEWTVLVSTTDRLSLVSDSGDVLTFNLNDPEDLAPLERFKRAS